MPNWPITLNAITEGAIIKASDLESNFTKLKNASNSMHERFSTLNFSCPINVFYDEYTSTSELDYLRVLGLHKYSPQTWDADSYTIFGLFQVPSWVQALRVRTFDVLNHSVIAGDKNDTPAVLKLTQSDYSVPTEIGLRYASSHTTFDQNAASAPGTAITSVSFTSGNAQGYTGTNETSPSIQSTTPNVLVLGGQWMAVYGRGGLKYTTDDDSSIVIGPVHLRFHVNIMCDAMVPIP